MQLALGVERGLGVARRDQLEAAEEPPAADVADVGMVAEAVLEAPLETVAQLPHAGQQVAGLDGTLNGQGRGAGGGVADVGMAVLEEARALGDGRADALADQGRADRLIAGAQPLGDGHQVRRHALLLGGEQAAGAAHAAHHLVEDQEDAVAIADLAHALEIARHGGHRAERRADHRLGDEGHHVLRPQALDLALELLGQPLAVGLRRLARSLVTIGVAGADVAHLDQQRLELAPTPGVATGGERPEGVAVVALAPGDQVPALGLAALDEVLARQLQGRLHRLGATGDEVDRGEAGRRPLDQEVGQCLHRLGGEEGAVGVGQLADLLAHGIDHLGVAVPQAGDRGTAAGVQVAAPLGVDQIGAVAADGGGIGVRQVTMEDVAHATLPGPYCKHICYFG